MKEEQFKITQVSFVNVYGTEHKMSGSIYLIHNGTSNRLEIQLNSDDCSAIIDVVRDRIIATVSTAARLFHETLVPPEPPTVIEQSAPSHGDEAERMKNAVRSDVEIPF